MVRPVSTAEARMPSMRVTRPSALSTGLPRALPTRLFPAARLNIATAVIAVQAIPDGLRAAWWPEVRAQVDSITMYAARASRPNTARATDRAAIALTVRTTTPTTFQHSVAYSRANPWRSSRARLTSLTLVIAGQFAKLRIMESAGTLVGGRSLLSNSCPRAVTEMHARFFSAAGGSAAQSRRVMRAPHQLSLLAQMIRSQ